MIYYLSFFGIFAGLGLACVFLKSNKLAPLYGVAGLVSTVLFIAIAGFRHETGFDWLAYESIYYGDSSLITEPGYVWFLGILHWSGLPFWTSQLLVAGVSAWSIWSICRYLNIDSSAPVAMYVAWLYLDVQMGVSRTAVALSLVTFALVFLSQKKILKGWLFLGLSLLFHSVAFIFILIYLLRRLWQWATQKTVRLVAIYCAAFVVGRVIASKIFTLQGAFYNTYFESRGQIYLSEDVSLIFNYQALLKISLMISLSFLLIHFHKKCNLGKRNNSRIINTFSLAVVAYPVAVLLFTSVYVVHDRVFYFSIVAMAMLLSFYMNITNTAFFRLFYTASLFAGIYVSSITLRSFNSVVFVPYQSQVSVLLGDVGSGRQRTQWYYWERAR